MENINILESSFNGKYKCKMSKPHLVNYFSVNLNENRHLNDFSGLKFVPEVYFKSTNETRKFRIQIKYRQETCIEMDNNVFWSWLDENENQNYIQNAEFITYRNLLSEIMDIPFKRYEWNDLYISVTLRNNKIFMKEAPENKIIHFKKDLKSNLKYLKSKYCLQQYRKFLVNSEQNSYKPCALHIRRNCFDNTFYEIFEILVEKHRILYCSEVDGIFSLNPINSIEDLQLAEHIEANVTEFLPFCKYRKRKLISKDNAIKLWSKSKLSLAEYTVNAVYFCNEIQSKTTTNADTNNVNQTDENKDDLWRESLSFIKLCNVDSLPRKCNDKWSPKYSLRYLNDVLCTVKKVINMTATPERNVSEWILRCTSKFEAEPALVFDSVHVFAAGLSSLETSHSLKPANLSCDLEIPWQDGTSVYNYINSVTVSGLTGRIEFNEGRRSNFKLDLLKLKREELRKVGEWTPSTGINITDNTAFYETTTPNITLVVMTRKERPYVMVREGNATGNARYEGFCIDLLKFVAGQVGFQYAIRLVPDHMYGVYDPDTKQWNGIVKELMDKRADLAVASMTINYARESVIDFTKPFMNLGIGILFKVPSSQPTRLFSFMNPLAVEIWLYVLAAYLLVSFTLFVMARFSPYEWNNPHPCSPEAHIVENQFSVSNSFWFITGTFLRQGSGLNPKASKPMPNRMFSFLNPLAMEIWIWMIVAYIVVSFTIWIVARFSPSEWSAPATCGYCAVNESKFDKLQQFYEDDTDSSVEHEYPQSHAKVTYDSVLQNDFTLANAFWFTIGSLMQQGCDLNPKATSTRIVGGIWWFFTLIIISSYTANLAAFLTVERMITPIESAADLSEQTEIAYGTLEGGSTMTFFRDSKIGIYQKMWRYMESKKPSVFVPTYEDGIKRVLEGNYAFLMESTMLDYAVQRDCNLTQIGGLLDSKGYGIATPKGSPWRDKISLAILELQEKGVIQILYDKWWKNTGDVCNRDDKNKESKANALGVENIGGVFVVLLCGLALAILVAILEFCWNSKKNAQTDRQSLCSEMAEELRFAVRCHGSRQRPALKRNCARCSPGTTYVPSALEIQHINGETGILPLMEMKKASLPYDADT